jgi:glycine oxidase
MALPFGATLTRTNHTEFRHWCCAYADRVTLTPPSTLVVGAGIIGLMSAYRLATSGYGVTVFDPAPARGATWAAAGMLAPSGEIAPGEEDNYHLQRDALALWRDASDDLLALTGRRLAIHESGTLLVGFDASDRRLVEQYQQTAESFGAPGRRVDRATSPELFAHLSARITDGLLLSGDAWLDPDEAVELLLDALERLHVPLVTEEVLSIASDDQGVSATTTTRTFTGVAGILATGSAGLPREAIASGEHSVRPVHGVTLRVEGVDRSDVPTVRAFVGGRNFYMVSRPGGYNVLGATSEERSRRVLQLGELQRLLRDALDVVPELETATVLEHRVGLRPASGDLRPFFEPLQTKGWAWSSGHYRHGVTLAPLAAQWALSYAESMT